MKFPWISCFNYASKIYNVFMGIWKLDDKYAVQYQDNLHVSIPFCRQGHEWFNNKLIGLKAAQWCHSI